jgi:N-acetylneuraminic acid mutarotase
LIILEEKIEYLDDLTISSTDNKVLKSKLSFTKLATLKYPIFSFGSILSSNKIYVIGGDGSFKTDAFKKLQYEKPDFSMNDYIKELQFQFSGQYYKGNLLIYDINTNQWESSEIKFKKRAYHNLNIYNNIIYVLGGKRVSVNGKFEYLEDKIEVFDTNKATVTIDNTNPHQAANFASFTYNGTIITMGGSIKMSEKGSKTFTNKVHSYDINSGYWYELTNMPSAKEANGVLINDKIYLIGGFNGKELPSLESYDLLTDSWKSEGELFDSLGYPAVTHKDNIIYIFENEKIYTFNIDTKEMKEYLINLPFKASKLYYSEEKLYLIGGYIENFHSQYPS